MSLHSSSPSLTFFAQYIHYPLHMSKSSLHAVQPERTLRTDLPAGIAMFDTLAVIDFSLLLLNIIFMVVFCMFSVFYY